MRLEGKVAVIAGGTRSIGRAAVERFAEEGALVVFSGRNPEAGHDVERELRDRGLEARYVRADSSVEADVRNLVSTAVADGGRLDVLVNNAAVADLARGGVDGLSDRPMHEVSDEAIEMTLGTNLYGVFWTCRHALRQMLTQGSGSIINLSSGAASMGFPACPIYSASKGAVNALTKQIAADYGPFGIRSNAVVVGFVPQPGQPAPKYDDGNVEAALSGTLPSPSPAKAVDIANALLFLASDEARYFNGALVAADGGMTSHHGLAMQGWDMDLMVET